MNKEQLEKNISLIAWLLGAMLLITLSVLLLFEAEIQALTKDNPVYGLLIILIPISVFQYTNYRLVGKHRLELGISNGHMFKKLFLHPGLWLGLLLPLLLRAFSSS